MRYSIPIPRSRGFQSQLVEQSIIAPDESINDIFLHALFARVATQSGTHEFKTEFNRADNTIELDIPGSVLDFIETITVEPNLKRYVAWLIQSSGLISIRETNSDGTVTVSLDSIVSNSFAHAYVVRNPTGIIDWSRGNKQTITLVDDVNLTFLDPNGPTSLQIFIKQDLIGGHGITWPSNVKWPNGGVSPVPTGAPNAVDILSLVYDGDFYYGTMVRNFA